MGSVFSYAADLLRNLFRGKNKIDTAAINGALRHVGLTRRIEFLSDCNAPDVFDAAKCSRPIPVKARNDDCDQLAIPILGQRAQKNRDDIGPTTRFRNCLEPELSI